MPLLEAGYIILPSTLAPLGEPQYLPFSSCCWLPSCAVGLWTPPEYLAVSAELTSPTTKWFCRSVPYYTSNQERMSRKLAESIPVFGAEPPEEQ